MHSFAFLRRVSTRSTSIYRLFSTAHSAGIAPVHSIYLSRSSNPYFNLTFEDWLFRHKPHKEPLLFLYRDDPCVVIGRNQNPWKEVNIPALHAIGIPFIRRRSGGGTVYHDLGNTNFSIHLPRTSFDRHATAKIVLRAIRSLGIDANVNDRNDICVGKQKIRSAYKIVNNRAYHHGTMLISTRLDALGALLRSDKETMMTKGVASVRSPVCNLQQFNTAITHDVCMDAIVHEFQNEFLIEEDPLVVDETDEWTTLEYIQRGMNELPSWNWAYGQTPEFEYTLSNSFPWGEATVQIRSKHGMILSCSLTLPGRENEASRNQLQHLAERLKGMRYGFVEDLDIRLDGHSKDVWHWVQREINE